MLSKILSLFSFLNWIFGWLHDQAIRQQIAKEQQLDLQKGKTLRAKVELESAKMTDAQHNARLEKTGGFRD